MSYYWFPAVALLEFQLCFLLFTGKSTSALEGGENSENIFFLWRIMFKFLVIFQYLY